MIPLVYAKTVFVNETLTFPCTDINGCVDSASLMNMFENSMFVFGSDVASKIDVCSNRRLCVGGWEHFFLGKPLLRLVHGELCTTGCVTMNKSIRWK